MTTFNIKIISDNVCPWCYIGKVRLDKAISLYKTTYPGGSEDTFNVTWAPFYLDPTSPAKGIPWSERVAQKFGADRIEAIKARLGQIGSMEGINFSFNGLIGNTRDSHRVIQLAKLKEDTAGKEGLQSSVVKEIMRSFFEEGGDITSRDMLVAAAAKGGLDADETKTWLEEGKGGPEVDKEVREANLLGVTGVPHFVFDGKHQLGGAADPSEFVAQIIAIKEGTS